MGVRPANLEIARFRTALLRFYDERRRDLPWRRDADPYRVWVSEIMLQQTRVETVIPYYERWLERFPDIDALAHADTDDVIRAWEGLGYYSRARNLHRAARIVRERHAGEVPAEPESLRSLPGIGDYTAGAIASIAFDLPEPAIDGNVRRVLARITDDEAPDPASLRQLARDLVDRDRPGDFNQALMELGATICTPRAPACDRCPVADQCAARRNGTQEERPMRTPARALPTFDVATLVLRDPDGRFLLERRPDRGLLAGMWTFPGRELRPGESGAAGARRTARDVLDGGSPRLRPTGRVEHTFTHRREIYLLFAGGTRSSARGRARWFSPDEAAAVAMPKAQRRIQALARDGARR